MHRADVCLISEIYASRFMRKLFYRFQIELKRKGFTARDVWKPIEKTKIIPFGDGFEFDLGGKIIKTMHVPGHTLGSVAFIDDADGCLFVGDNAAPCLWMFLPHASTVEEWASSAEKLVESGEKYDVYWGHGDGRLTVESMKSTLETGRRLLAEKKNSILPLIKIS